MRARRNIKVEVLAHITDLGTMETLMELLAERSAQPLVYANLAQEIQVAVDTVKRWVDLPPSPSGAVIWYTPSLVPAVRAIERRLHRRGSRLL